jgi:hypothetical protein
MRLARKLLRSTGVTAGVLLAVGTAAGAASRCVLDKREYPENSVVCSAGLALFCANGVWQNTDGARCNAPTGSYLTPRRPYEKRNDEPMTGNQPVLPPSQPSE